MKLIAPLAALVVLGAAALLYGMQRDEVVTDPGTAAFWSDRMDAVGIEAARDELIAAIHNQSAMRAHEMSHAFGDALYQAGAPLGDCPILSVTEEFASSGCMHEFIGHLLQAEGAAALDIIRSTCIEKGAEARFHCDHAIGHGLLAWHGYDEDGVQSALESCTRASTSNNCYRAVFMEYDFRTMLDGAYEIRKSQEGDYHAMCKGLLGSVRDTCVYWQPNWWIEALRYDGIHVPAEQVPRMRELCLAWPNKTEQHLCFVAVGFTLMYLEAGIDRSVSLCEAHFQPAEQRYCRLGVASRYRSIGHGTEIARRACIGLVEGKRECIDIANGILNTSPDLPKRVIW
jgi:hypothetical protein